jgi:hypothetical protein
MLGRRFRRGQLDEPAFEGKSRRRRFRFQRRSRFIGKLDHRHKRISHTHHSNADITLSGRECHVVPQCAAGVLGRGGGYAYRDLRHHETARRYSRALLSGVRANAPVMMVSYKLPNVRKGAFRVKVT